MKSLKSLKSWFLTILCRFKKSSTNAVNVVEPRKDISRPPRVPSTQDEPWYATPPREWPYGKASAYYVLNHGLGDLLPKLYCIRGKAYYPICRKLSKDVLPTLTTKTQSKTLWRANDLKKLNQLDKPSFLEGTDIDLGSWYSELGQHYKEWHQLFPDILDAIESSRHLPVDVQCEHILNSTNDTSGTLVGYLHFSGLMWYMDFLNSSEHTLDDIPSRAIKNSKYSHNLTDVIYRATQINPSFVKTSLSWIEDKFRGVHFFSLKSEIEKLGIKSVKFISYDSPEGLEELKRALVVMNARELDFKHPLYNVWCLPKQNGSVNGFTILYDSRAEFKAWLRENSNVRNSPLDLGEEVFTADTYIAKSGKWVGAHTPAKMFTWIVVSILFELTGCQDKPWEYADLVKGIQYYVALSEAVSRSEENELMFADFLQSANRGLASWYYGNYDTDLVLDLYWDLKQLNISVL